MKIKILCDNQERDVVNNYFKNANIETKLTALLPNATTGVQQYMVCAEINRPVAMPKSRYIKPTIDEIKAYCIERRNAVDADAFYDFYESKGWLVGRTKMKDWRASVRTWEKRKFDDNISQSTNKSHRFDGERTYTEDELTTIFGDRSDVSRLDDIEF